MSDLEKRPQDLTPRERQVLERIKNGDPHRIPAAQVETVFASLVSKGYAEEVSEAE
jgi:FixJ family two-component response regulator